MNKFLALDQALKTSAWSFFDNGNLKKFGNFTIPANKPIADRLYSFWKELDALYMEFEFEHLFFEDIQQQNNAETYKKLAYVQAAILLWCYMREIDYTILAPSHWRALLKQKYKVSFGRARAEQKKNAMEFAAKQFPQHSFTEDEADSVCIGLAGMLEKRQNECDF